MDEFRNDLKAQQEARKVKDINLLNMIESRIMEIVQIEDECKKKMPKLYSQRLPRFMRRRAACHDVKRLPRKLRPKSDAHLKSRMDLLRYRKRIRTKKNKRILKRHSRHTYKDPVKCLMHKWFAKRFRMASSDFLIHVPLYNNTKNQRNLYRQSRYGCAFISMAHLVPIIVDFELNLKIGTLRNQLLQLNKLTYEISGFTFNAIALATSQYETLIHLYKPADRPGAEREYICSVLAHMTNRTQVELPEKIVKKKKKTSTSCQTQLKIWVPREKVEEVFEHLRSINEQLPANKFSLTKIYPQDQTRVRLVGPNAWSEALKVSEKDKVNLGDETDVKAEIEEQVESEQFQAQKDASQRLGNSNDHNGSGFGLTIGRFVEEKFVDFIYYNTEPPIVDLVFKTKAGRMLWHTLVKNKAHLVGGYRDLDRLLPAEKYKLIPDHIADGAMEEPMRE